MKVRTVLLLLALLLLAVFAIVNWAAFSAPTQLSLLVAQVQAPLGIIMLGICVLLAAFFLAYIAFQQMTMLADTRRAAREVQTAHELADKAEASRYNELRQWLQAELDRLRTQGEQAGQTVHARLDALERALLRAGSEHVNSLAAMVGEVDDKLNKAMEGKR